MNLKNDDCDRYASAEATKKINSKVEWDELERVPKKTKMKITNATAAAAITKTYLYKQIFYKFLFMSLWSKTDRQWTNSDQEQTQKEYDDDDMFLYLIYPCFTVDMWVSM